MVPGFEKKFASLIPPLTSRLQQINFDTMRGGAPKSHGTNNQTTRSLRGPRRAKRRPVAISGDRIVEPTGIVRYETSLRLPRRAAPPCPPRNDRVLISAYSKGTWHGASHDGGVNWHRLNSRLPYPAACASPLSRHSRQLKVNCQRQERPPWGAPTQGSGLGALHNPSPD